MCDSAAFGGVAGAVPDTATDSPMTGYTKTVIRKTQRPKLDPSHRSEIERRRKKSSPEKSSFPGNADQ